MNTSSTMPTTDSENYANKQLLCTFTTKERLKSTLNFIFSKYDVDRIYLLETETSEEILCTYNINLANFENKEKVKIKNTMSIHRKKDTNTLYTINAINLLVKTLNNGIDNKEYVIDWENYKNQLLLIDKEKNFKTINTKLIGIRYNKNNNEN